MKWLTEILYGIIFVCLILTFSNLIKIQNNLNKITSNEELPDELTEEAKGDRIDEICGDSNYAVCLIANDNYGYSEHKKKFIGCGCGKTKEDAVAFAITGWVNQHFYVDFEILLNDYEGTHEELTNRVFSFYNKMDKKRNSRKYRKWRK